MRWRVVAAAFAVVLAGCGALGGAPEQSGGRSADTPTLTPVPVPEATTAPPRLPPGLTGANVTDANALVDAHLAAIRGRSYTLAVRVRIDGERSERLLRVETPTRYYRVDRLADRGDTVQFADGDDLYTRTEYRGDVRYGRFDDPSLPRSQTVALSRAFLRVDDVRVAETRVDGDVAYELTGRYPVHPSVDTLANFSLRAIVEPDGFIRSLNVSYVRTGTGDGTTVSRSFVYSDVDATTVEEPAWVDREFDRGAETGRPVATDS
ncbi:MAG: hypothetical protein ABEJ26_09425 [Halosimplex sp.]